MFRLMTLVYRVTSRQCNCYLSQLFSFVWFQNKDLTLIKKISVAAAPYWQGRQHFSAIDILINVAKMEGERKTKTL